MKEKLPRKVLVYRCKHHECEHDMMGCRYSWCHNEKCSSRTCLCESIFQMMFACPYYKRGEKQGFLKYDKYDKKLVEELKQKLQKEKDDTEAAEKALYLKLKQKYEGTLK